MSDVTPFTHLDSTVVGQIRAILYEELPKILDPLGVSFELGNAGYIPEEGSLKFNNFRLAVSLDGGKPLNAKGQALRVELERRKGGPDELDPQKPGATIDGQECILVGYKPRATKRPFVIEMLETGKQYVIPVRMANANFGGEDNV